MDGATRLRHGPNQADHEWLRIGRWQCVVARGCSV
jgi:hypothetical protein